MHQQGHRGAGQESEGEKKRESGESGKGPQGLNVENVVHGRDDKSPGHDPRDVGIKHDHQGPVNLKVVGEDIPRGRGRDFGKHVHQVTSLLRPR